MSDCRTCKFNTYINLENCAWVSCGHPKTLEKTPKYEAGDPVWVNAMTADMAIKDMHSYQMSGCTAWELHS